MRRTWAVARKELRQVARDPISLIMLLGLPAFMLVLYGYALNFDVRHVPLAVQDNDKSSASRELISSFVNSTYFDQVASPAPGTDLESLTERRLAKAILVIPEGFARRLASGQESPVQLLLDGTDEAARRARQMLAWDVTNGLSRRAWAGNPGASFAVRQAMVDEAALQVTLPHPADPDVVDDALREARRGPVD